MDPDSLKGKVFLAVIEKVLIGGVVYILFTLCNSVYDRHQRELEQAIAVSKVHTEILSEQRRIIIDQIQQYLEMEETMAEGKPSRESVGKLGDRISKLKLASIQVGPIAPGLQSAVDSLAGDMSRLHELLDSMAYSEDGANSTSSSRRRQLKQMILSRYGRLLEQMRTAAVKSIREDMSSSRGPARP